MVRERVDVTEVLPGQFQAYRQSVQSDSATSIIAAKLSRTEGQTGHAVILVARPQPRARGDAVAEQQRELEECGQIGAAAGDIEWLEANRSAGGIGPLLRIDIGEQARLDLAAHLETVPAPGPLQSQLHSDQIVLRLPVEIFMVVRIEVRAAQSKVVGQVEIANAPQPRKRSVRIEREQLEPLVDFSVGNLAAVGVAQRVVENRNL